MKIYVIIHFYVKKRIKSIDKTIQLCFTPADGVYKLQRYGVYCLDFLFAMP